MLFLVLGPLEVRGRDGAAVRLGAGKPAAVLAALLVQPNAWVGVEQLITSTWQEQAAPASAESNLKTYVWQLRRVLPATEGEAPRIESRPGAYRLRVADDELDAGLADTLAVTAQRAAERGDAAAAENAAEQALALWRGDAFEGLDLPASAGEHFGELHRRLRETLAGARLARGDAAGAVPVLRELTATDPLRESAWALLVRALHAQGRRAEALTAYRAASEALATELDAEPGPELTRAARVCAGGAPRRELPRDVPAFTGRTRELAAVCEASGPVLVDGMPGTGKTALAVHAAHRIARHYPGGQLFVGLHGSGPRPVTAADALARLLRAFDVPVPSDVDERAARWRDVTATRRVLLVLDDAAGAAQVEPLLPAGGGCRTIVTTRDRSWHVDGAVRVALAPLGAVSAVELFRTLAGSPTARHADLIAITRECGGLSAAVRDAAAFLHSRPHWTVQRLATEFDPCRVFAGTLTSLAAQLGPERLRRLGDLSQTGTAAREQLVDEGLLDAEPAGHREHALLRHLARCGRCAPAGLLRSTEGRAA
ncbi:AfsR/SARP family transcriptional regulator [Prauserella cavernicola]|uniref:Winged helix-turn-helix domain-containing protein n=1 Tax=Prauserella cavernicola TaxID=2800127 RepID=A0A934R0Y6_9PSEU|nr:BTAD domain-containing putative transcriptional regulator [Prauserella cavernicola]MBK1789079.1 winged helix-turn-helix domain-containing protein [Prauserella cavernicola]